MLNREDRSRIRQAVLAGRHLLEEEFDQLLRAHGLLPDRKVSVPGERAAIRAALEEALAREGLGYARARERYLKHAAFTFLNRVLALRVAEANGLAVETVIMRPEYGGRSRREYDLADADPELAVAPERLVQEALRQAFAELRSHLPILFREDDPYALLWPRPTAYRGLREILAGLPEELWREFETLGWAYQFFNSQEREEICRDLRRNPKPDHIPPLNQFYTVDWIVRALVHNTLGRLWLEAYPDSPLREKLAYFVPIRNHFRPPERRRSVEEMKVLDPACGSGHFLLGAFDLLLHMWREEHPEIPAWQIPALILERNLYGVDIDLRACQIAALALWLKAYTTFESLKQGDPAARFKPNRINIVCADVRFVDGNRCLRFLGEFSDPDLREIAQEILAACNDTFEIGSLLRIRQPFEELFAKRKTTLKELQKMEGQLSLFPLQGTQLALGDSLIPVPKPLTVEEIVEGIRCFGREASEANDMGSQFFGLAAEQAAHLMDVLSERYDVVLMNPPYGAMPAGCKEYARRNYPRTYHYYYAAFIEQAVDLCKEGGYVGALTGRTFLFLKSFQQIREEILRESALPEIIWDLGFNVLDEATARYAAFTLRRRHANDGVDWTEHPVTFFRLTDWAWEEKRVQFEEALAEMHAGEERGE
ncbi:MAG: hypothetical protein GX492_10700 [Firmicutes bacterium]|nr:hypothetical protein [Bacillota bacterium]